MARISDSSVCLHIQLPLGSGETGGPSLIGLSLAHHRITAAIGAGGARFTASLRRLELLPA